MRLFKQVLDPLEFRGEFFVLSSLFGDQFPFCDEPSDLLIYLLRCKNIIHEADCGYAALADSKWSVNQDPVRFPATTR